MNAPDKEKSIRGNVRRAWRVPPPPNAPALLSQWLMFCPEVHPVWSYWLLSLIHLRDIPGTPKPIKTDPRNEYELSVYALDPECRPDARNQESLRPLLPPDQVDQFYTLGDEQGALDIAAAMVDAVVCGEISPDSDFRDSWKRTLARGCRPK